MIIKKEDLKRLTIEEFGSYSIENQNKILIIFSVALTSRISYTTIGENSEFTFKKAKEMYEKLKNSGHWSCFGHIAKCMTDDERNTWIKGELKQVSFSEFDSETFLEAPEEAKGFSKNLRGFIPLRQYVEAGVELSKFK